MGFKNPQKKLLQTNWSFLKFWWCVEQHCQAVPGEPPGVRICFYITCGIPYKKEKQESQEPLSGPLFVQDSGTTDRIDFSLLGPLEVDLSDDATQSHWRVLSKPIGNDKITSETQSTPRGLVLVNVTGCC